MTARMLLSNIASFALQITVLVAAGAVLARAFRLNEPRAMLAYWRTLLFACLALPFCQPWITVLPAVLAGPPAAILSAAGAALVPSGPIAPLPPRPAPWPIVDVAVFDIALFLLAAGVGARALWLTMGAYGLRRLRRRASPLEPLPESVRRAQERMGTRASIYVSDRVSSPITFGLLRPVVMFPPSVPAMPPHVQEAIAYHELLHVRRRDWLHEIAEQIVRSVLWFHPAIWWLTGRIQLTREQVVDQAAIRLTDSRERYVESLLAVARVSSPAAFAPASAFLRRHCAEDARRQHPPGDDHDDQKIDRFAHRQRRGAGPCRNIRRPVVPARGAGPGARRHRRTDPVVCGRRAPAARTDARVPAPGHAAEDPGRRRVDLTLDDGGEVSDARVLNGPDELRKATLEAVLQWHYSPAALSSTVTQATLRFRVPSDLEDGRSV